MLSNLLIGLPVMLLCLLLQAFFVAICLRYYVRFKHARLRRESLWQDVLLLSVVMVLMLLGNFVQMAIWAVLFMLLGEFGDFATALYHSGVNFATLGYGDIVMSHARRSLGPLEAANGILMFGVSTSVMTAAVLDVIRHNLARLRRQEGP
ncbi:two pore domain potassium channel family protein [Cupriavidus taiwanensis]|uniref:potassium channel family protein n=1 Tax=Cupriavidus taiwanensis TaxID=164546 RepID=UPI001571E766|nr:potassium channel family protein [Cupriavidus taiwanensis]NSX15953.1 two pore domain potassium channel family protein [Cupriavidus taiwanensis]